MGYEWDENKRASNIVCPSVDFVQVKNFDWVTCLTHAHECFKRIGISFDWLYWRPVIRDSLHCKGK